MPFFNALIYNVLYIAHFGKKAGSVKIFKKL